MVNRHPAGAPASKGGEFAPSIDGKSNIPTAKSVATLAKTVDALEVEAEQKDDDKSWNAYEEARAQLDNAFKALLPGKIANLSVGDEVDFVFINPDYEGYRAELKASNAIITKKVLADLKADTLTREGFTLLDILPSGEPIDEENEISITTEESDGTVTKVSYQDPERAIRDFDNLLEQI